MAAEFEIYHSGIQYRWRLQGNNNEKLLASEAYTTLAGAQKGVESAKANAPIDARYDRLISSRGRPYYVLRAGNGEVIGVSEEYSTTQAMEAGIAAVKRVAPTAPVRVLP